MQIGMIGLGKMGGAMSRRLIKAGHQCVVYARTAKSRDPLAKDGATAATSLEEAVKMLKSPRAVWLMLPAGEATEKVVEQLAALLEPDDIVIDGGNSFYKDDIRRAKMLDVKGIHYVDCGTSGGVWGSERGYCLMVGGSKAAVERLDPIFGALAPGQGDIPRTPGRDGQPIPLGARLYPRRARPAPGHFVKMVHNGIEYGLMQAYGEGFDILRNKDSNDLPEDERLRPRSAGHRRGLAARQRRLVVAARSGRGRAGRRTRSSRITPASSQDSGEGRWTVEAAIEEAVPADLITAALYARFRSRRDQTFSEKMLSAMRFGFGGHVEGAEPIDPERKRTASVSSDPVKHAAK